MVLPRLSDMQRRFAKAHAQTGDPHYAAWKAGYADPISSGNQLKHNPAVQESIRADTQRFLFEKAGALSVNVLVEVAGDKSYKVDARVRAATELAKLANIAITDAAAEKPATELTAGELGSLVEEMRRELVRQREIAANALAALPTAIIEWSIFD
jgi:phage terminase small subunit